MPPEPTTTTRVLRSPRKRSYREGPLAVSNSEK